MASWYRYLARVLIWRHRHRRHGGSTEPGPCLRKRVLQMPLGPWIARLVCDAGDPERRRDVAKADEILMDHPVDDRQNSSEKGHDRVALDPANAEFSGNLLQLALCPWAFLHDAGRSC
jgi:hypothetical protein